MSEPAQTSSQDSALLEVRVSMPSADTAHTLATELVGRGLAACVQCLGPMTSVYTWEGETEQATEWLLLAKTTAERFEELSAVVAERHPYETPEVVAVPITHALAAYGAWVQDSVDPRLD